MLNLSELREARNFRGLRHLRALQLPVYWRPIIERSVSRRRFVHAPRGHSQADFDEPRELVFVTEDATWAEADAFGHDPADDWYRQPPDDEARELTYVDEDTFWSEF